MAKIVENLQLGCAICRIGIYAVFRRLCCGAPPPPKPEFSPVCIGLDKSGKTSLLTALSGDNMDDIEPTTGFQIKAILFSNCILNVKEIGGGEKVRPYWKHYYRGAEGVVFVFDSASSDEQLTTAIDAFHDAIEHHDLKNLPCLILANCQDKEGARTVEQLTEDLELKSVLEGRQWAIHGCSLKDVNSIRQGFVKLNNFFLASNQPDNTHQNEKGEPNRV